LSNMYIFLRRWGVTLQSRYFNFIFSIDFDVGHSRNLKYSYE
jgi:hypothetical protein